MPPRHFIAILLVGMLSIACHVQSRRVDAGLLVGEAVQLIEQFYVEPVQRDKLVGAAMKGLTTSLDENSGYIAGEAFSGFQETINQEFAGIGIFVEPSEDGPVRVITPLVGSPALEAGLMPNDLIVQIDGDDSSQWDLQRVSQRLRGPVGTSVSLVLRRGDDQVSTEVQRKTIKMESVIGDHRDNQNRWVYRLADAPEIAYLRMTSFGEKTVQELRDQLIALDNDFDALVLDLRSNPGGLLNAGVSVCDMFLESGEIVSTRIRDGQLEDEWKATAGVLVDSEKPVAVLIDDNSASASEIVAGCLQDHGRATIVGIRSFGKGTVQNIFPMQYGRSALRLTVARYYRPSGKNIHRTADAKPEDDWGVLPDAGMEVELD
ncbi:MAG: S41 family peptidase, partial [Planctomycetota bacterium]